MRTKQLLLSLSFFCLSHTVLVSHSPYEFQKTSYKPVIYDPQNLKIIGHSSITVSTDIWTTGFNFAKYLIGYIHTSKQTKRTLAERTSIDQHYRSWSEDQYKYPSSQHSYWHGEHWYGELQCNESNHSDYLPCSNTLNPLFEKLEFYRFPEFQKVLYQDKHFECSILKIEQALRFKSSYELNPKGYHQGELQAIVHAMADKVRQDRIDRILQPERLQEEERARKLKEQRIEHEKTVRNNALKRSISHVLTETKNELYALYTDLDLPVPQSTEQDIIRSRRQEALSHHLEGNDVWSEQYYAICPLTESLLTENHYHKRTYQKLYGIQIQQVIHQEFITILSRTASIQDVRKSSKDDCKGISTTISRFAYAGQLHNRSGYIKDACSFADFCYGILNGLTQAYDFECELENAIGRGVEKGFKQFAKKADDPIDSLCDLINDTRNLAQALVRFSDNVRSKALEALNKKIKQSLEDGKNVVLGNTTCFNVLVRDALNVGDSVNQSVADVHDSLKAAWANIDRPSVLYATEEGSAILTEMALSHATFSALGSMVSNGTNALEGIIDAGDGCMPFFDLPFTSATFEASISYESILVRAHEEVLQIAYSAGVTLSDALDKGSKIVPIVNAIGGIPDNLSLGGDLMNIDGLQYPITYRPMIEDIPEIHSMFHETRKGFGDKMCNKYIKINLEHILEGEVITKVQGTRTIKDLYGCHHDFLGHLEKNNIITLRDKFFGPFGTYNAKAMGHDTNKCFFPQHWLRKEVIKNIYEAYDEFIGSGRAGKLRLDGKWEITGTSKLGLNIQMFINQSGTILTAYPNI